MRNIVLVVAAAAALPLAHAANLGPYATTYSTFTNDAMDRTDKRISVFYPTDVSVAPATPFKFISYAHGMYGGGVSTVPGYYSIGNDLASFGYVVAFHHSCSVGCEEDHTSLPDDPKGFGKSPITSRARTPPTPPPHTYPFLLPPAASPAASSGHYYLEQLKVIDWIKLQPSSEAMMTHLDLSHGVGVCGHSMGGQSAMFSSSANSTSHDIRAAVLHHAYTHTFATPSVPFLAFTGDADDTAPVQMAVGIYEGDGGSDVRGIVDRVDATHTEPVVGSYNPLLAKFTAAWFKLFLDGVTTEGEMDYERILFEDGTDTVCGGGDGKVNDDFCEVVR